MGPCNFYGTIALWVRLNVKREIGKFLPHPSFYPCPNISDRYPPHHTSHFIRIQIFQIYIFRRRDEHFSISISHLHAKETFVNQLRKEKGTSWTLLKDPNIWCNQVVWRFLQNNICNFRSPISPWRAALRNTLFSNFFLQMTKLRKCKKFRPSQTPPLVFGMKNHQICAKKMRFSNRVNL